MNSKVICITGGIGSGKSTVCALIEQRGFPVYYSDTRAKELMEGDSKVVDAITALFSEAAYQDGKLNRRFLADQIFTNPTLKARLEAIVHPAVREDFKTWCSDQSTSLVFKESALALEVTDDSCSRIVSVIADRELRIARVLCRNMDWSLSQVLERMKHQTSDAERVERSDFIVRNDHDIEVLGKEVDQLLTMLNDI